MNTQSLPPYLAAQKIIFEGNNHSFLNWESNWKNLNGLEPSQKINPSQKDQQTSNQQTSNSEWLKNYTNHLVELAIQNLEKEEGNPLNQSLYIKRLTQGLHPLNKENFSLGCEKAKQFLESSSRIKNKDHIMTQLGSMIEDLDVQEQKSFTVFFENEEKKFDGLWTKELTNIQEDIRQQDIRIENLMIEQLGELYHSLKDSSSKSPIQLESLDLKSNFESSPGLNPDWVKQNLLARRAKLIDPTSNQKPEKTLQDAVNKKLSQV